MPVTAEVELHQTGDVRVILDKENRAFAVRHALQLRAGDLRRGWTCPARRD
jgi:hypothetical protein